MDSDDKIVCVICKKNETDASKIITCKYCYSNAHFKCKNILGNAVRRMRESDYFCTADCSSIFASMQNSNNSLMPSLAAEIKATISASFAKEMQSIKIEVRQITTSIEKSQEFLSAKFDDIVTDFKDLRQENEELKIEIGRLKKSQLDLQGTVSKLEANVDKSDKAALGNNAILWGIPAVGEENITQLVDKFLSCLNITSDAGFVVSAERMFTNEKSNGASTPIRIVFKDKESKEIVFNKKKQIGKLPSNALDSRLTINGRVSTVALRDELSPLALELLKELRDCQELLNVKYIWAGRGGVILVKKEDNSKPILVKTREDLTRVKNILIKTAISDSPGSSRNTPSPKRKKNNVK